MEQSYKEKYEQALAKAKEQYNYPCMRSCMGILEEIFPELAESEDEKMMKEIIDLIMQPIWKTEKEFHRRNELCAWIKKQGQVKESHISQHENKMCKENDDSLTSEDEKVRKDLIGFFKDEAFLCHKKKQIIAWLKKQGESPIKWNKNTKDCKPQKNHSVLMKTTHGIAEGEWQGEKWFQYRWSSRLKDDDVLSWVEFHDLEKQGETFPVLSNSSNIGKDEQKHFDYENANIQQKDFAQKVEPKFKVGDKIYLKPEYRMPNDDTPIANTVKEIRRIDDKYYRFDGSYIFIEDQDKYELVEQKPAWSEEDEKMLDSVRISINEESIAQGLRSRGVSHSIEDLTTILSKQINWLKSLQDRVQPQPKQEWSEEDDDDAWMNDIISKVENNLQLNKAEIDWLKSIRPQNNVTDEELAKAKKDAYNDALDKIEYHSGEPTFDDGWSAAIDYIRKKSLRPQNHWKPSDEQIKVCKEVYADILSAKGFDLGTVVSELNRMEEQLNKLKEDNV